MNNPIRAAASIALAICCTVLGACAQADKPAASTPPAANPWDPSVAAKASRIASPPRGRNLVANPASLDGWHAYAPAGNAASGVFDKVPGATRGSFRYELVGTGQPPTAQVISPSISVVPGGRYSFSASIDNTKVADRWTVLWVSNPVGDVVYSTAIVPRGQNGRFGFVVHVPADVRNVRVGFYTASCKLPKGEKLSFAGPSFVALDKGSKRS